VTAHTTATVVGDALLDVVVAPTEPMRTGADVPAAIDLGPGGQGANVAVRLARRGVATRLVCGLGDDAMGQLVRRVLEAEGVELVAIDVPATGAVVVIVGEDGERTMLSRRAPFATGIASVPGAGWVAVSGYLLLEPDADRVTASLASRSDRRALLCCAVPDGLLDRWARAAGALAPHLVVGNRDEVARLRLPDALVVATDVAGAEAWSGGRRVRADAPPGPPAVDTTGAGDAFAATLLAALGDGWPPPVAVLERAMAAAVDAAAATTGLAGAQGRIPGERAATLSP
jgi:sugar/nucleoside kinase (ribokinase family)